MKPDVATLVANMKDHSSTAGWDAVCSYDAAQLNDLLTAQLKTLHQALNIPLGTPENPYRTTYTSFNVPHVAKGLTMRQVNYAFGLDLPTLQFTHADSRALLTMPITSAAQTGFSYTLTYAGDADQTAAASLKENTWYVRNKASQQLTEQTPQQVLSACWDAGKQKPRDPFPASYYYRAANADILPDFNHKLYILSSIDRAFPATADKPSDPFEGKAYFLQARVPLAAVAGNQLIPAGTVVTFDAGQGRTEGQVILNFNIATGTGAEFTLLDAKSPGDVANIEKDAPTLMEDLRVYFSQALGGIQLRLAGVTVGKETPDLIPVKPRSFLFSSTAVDQTSVLSIFLNIDGSFTPDPAGQPSFQYNTGKAGIPVPDPYSASLILSRDYLTRHYFPKAFTRAGFSQINPRGGSLNPISFTGNYHRPKTVAGKPIPIDMSFAASFSNFEGAEFGTVHLDDYTFGFTMRSDGYFEIAAPRAARINIPIYLHYSTPASPRAPPHHTTTQKTATVTLTLDKSISIADAQPDPDGFSLAFSIEKTDYSVTSSSDIGNDCDDHTQRDVESAVRDEIGNIAPGIAVRLPELQTLALENLIFNGETRFHLTPAAKMHFPHDLLLLGELE